MSGREWKAWSWGGQIRATLSRSFFIRAMINRAYPLHPVINGMATYIYTHIHTYIASRTAAIQLIFVALFAVEKRSDPLATFPSSSFDSHFVTYPPVARVHGSICTRAFIESRPVNRFSAGKSIQTTYLCSNRVAK